MPKGTPEKIKAIQEEIITACEQLYKTKGFKEITIKDIGNLTTFSRTSIYNYYNTKEEIFLALLHKEYKKWIKDLEKILNKHDKLTREEFADKTAKSIEKRPQMLKILSMNHYDMEEESREDNLVEFKKSYGKSMTIIRKCLEKYFPELTKQEQQNFIYTFFPYLFGIYPYTIVTPKQKSAMKKAKVNYAFMTIYEITYNTIIQLLKT